MPLPFFARKYPIGIAAYAGFRNRERLQLRARILRRKEARPPGSGWLGKTAHLLRLYASHEIPGVRVRIDGEGFSAEAESDGEGFVDFDIGFDEKRDLPAFTSWEQATLTLPDHNNVSAEASVLALGGDGRLGVISDIDDTIIETGVHDFFRNWRRVLAEAPEDRIAVPGASALYRSLSGKTGPEPDAPLMRPFFYVSSSPWNLYGFLAKFMEINDLPRGPMLMRDWGFNRSTLGGGSHGEHKIASIERILAFYPQLRFIMIGDDTQGDAAAFAKVVEKRPDRIAAVLLRMATGEQLDPEKQAALDSIRDHGVRLWTGDGYNAGDEILSQLGLDPDGETAELLDTVTELKE